MGAVADLDPADVAVDVGHHDHALGRRRAAVAQRVGRLRAGPVGAGVLEIEDAVAVGVGRRQRRGDRGDRAVDLRRPGRRRRRDPAVGADLGGRVGGVEDGLAVAVVDHDPADVAVGIGQDHDLLDRRRAAVAQRIGRRRPRAVGAGVGRVGHAVAVAVRRRQGLLDRDHVGRQRPGRGLDLVDLAGLAGDHARRVGLVEQRLVLAVVDLDRADVAVGVGQHDDALEARPARPRRRVGEREQDAGVGPGAAGDRAADAERQADLVGGPIAGAAVQLQPGAVLRRRQRRQPDRDQRLGADAERAGAVAADPGGRPGQLGLAADGVAAGRGRARQDRGPTGQHRRVGGPAHRRTGVTAGGDAGHAAHGRVAGEIGLGADRDPQVGRGVEGERRVGVAEQPGPDAQPRIADGGAARSDAGERRAALGEHQRQAGGDGDAAQRREGDVEVGEAGVGDWRRHRDWLAAGAGQLRGQQIVGVVEGEVGGERARPRVPRRLDDQERVPRRGRLEVVELVADVVGERPRGRTGPQGAGGQEAAEETGAQLRAYSTETTNVVPRTPRTVRGVLILTEPGCCRVSSPVRTIIVPFLIWASRLPLRCFGSKK